MSPGVFQTESYVTTIGSSTTRNSFGFFLVQLSTIRATCIVVPASCACDRGRVGRNAQRRATGKRLRAGLHVNQVQARAQALFRLQILQELQQVPGETGRRGRGHKAVGGHVAVLPRGQLPHHARDGRRRDRGSSRRDRAGAAQCCEPDHDLVLVVAVCRRA